MYNNYKGLWLLIQKGKQMKNWFKGGDFLKLQNIISKELMAFLPVYMQSKGDCTKLYTKQGGVYEIEKTSRTVLNQLCKYYFVDLEAVKKYYGDILYIKNSIPIPFTGEDVFVYIKVRKPLYKNDGASGFVNIRYIDRVLKQGDKVLIQLINHEKIECLCSTQVINKRIRNGHIVKELYREKQRSMTIREYDSCDEYNKPITIGDIVFLAEKIKSQW